MNKKVKEDVSLRRLLDNIAGLGVNFKLKQDRESKLYLLEGSKYDLDRVFVSLDDIKQYLRGVIDILTKIK